MNRGRVNISESKIVAARRDAERSLRLYRGTAKGRPIDIAEVLIDLAQIHTWSDDILQAERTAREAIHIFELHVSPMYPDLVVAKVILADTLYLQGRLEESATILADALQKYIQLYGSNNVNVCYVLDRLGIVSYAQHKLAQAQRYSRDAVATCRVALGDRSIDTATAVMSLARTLIAHEEFAEAEGTLREALDVFSETLPPEHQHVASAEYFLGEVLLATNRLPEAETVLTSSMNRWKRGDAPPWRAMRSANALGEALYRQGRKSEGEKYLSESLRQLSADPKADREAKDKAKARAKRFLRTTLASG
jgi:tetratricopeptide (TPR) repeat protein